MRRVEGQDVSLCTMDCKSDIFYLLILQLVLPPLRVAWVPIHMHFKMGQKGGWDWGHRFWLKGGFFSGMGGQGDGRLWVPS